MYHKADKKTAWKKSKDRKKAVIVAVWKGIHFGSDANRAGAQGSFFVLFCRQCGRGAKAPGS